MPGFEVDVVIVGGGITGLWTLDELRRAGYRAILLENRALGHGQTVSSQGIIHGGLKYSLKGALTSSANEIRDMPGIWRDCLSGQREPNLSRTLIRSHSCLLWQSQRLSSQAGMLGAQINLRVKPVELKAGSRPELLRNTTGQVFRLDEQVLSPTSLLECFQERLNPYLLKIDETDGLKFGFDDKGEVSFAIIQCGQQEWTISCKRAIFTAGSSNFELSQQIGKAAPMQLRPLHMVLVRGNLPAFQGHCIDGAKTRLTITSEYIDHQQTIWQLGGQIAENGVKRTEEELVRFAAKELQETLPDLDVESLQFATYRIDRAEKKVSMGLRPDTPQIIKHRNTWTSWPTKLAFAPRVAESFVELLQRDLPVSQQQEPWQPEELMKWPKPNIAPAPWNEQRNWYQFDGEAIAADDQEFKQAG